MKDAEDEAFDELAKRQGDWGGGFPAKRKMAADKLQEYDQTALELCNVCGWKTLIPDDGCLNCERAQPAQEPVAWVCEGFASDEKHAIDYWQEDADDIPIGTLLYTKPPKRPWVGLTDEEMYLNCPNWLSQEQCKAWIQQIEAALKDKNT
jgi:hypothetical protein